MTFEEWKDGYGLVLEPNYSKETEADCLAAFNFGKRESADLIERQAVQIEMMREALGYRIDHPKVITALSFTPDQALEQFAERVREQSLAEYRNKVIEAFVNEFSRHVGGDGEFWLHELQDFAMKEL